MPLVLVAVSAIFSAAGLCGIIHFTILARTPSDTHIFMVFLDLSSNEFIREMVMNTFLFFPFGLFLPYVLYCILFLIVKHPSSSKDFPANTPILVTIAISFLLSLVIESWQYYAGTGTAQVTDAICNTLGAAIGTLSFALFSHLQGAHRSSETIE